MLGDVYHRYMEANWIFLSVGCGMVEFLVRKRHGVVLVFDLGKGDSGTMARKRERLE